MKPRRRSCRVFRSLHLFRVAGVPVQIHTTSLVFPWGFLLWVGWMTDRWTGLASMLTVLLMVQGSLLVHEFAHVLAAGWLGCETRRVLLIPFGCLAELEEIPPEPGEIWMAAAGPAASTLLSLLFWVCSTAAGSSASLDCRPSQLLLSVAWMTNLGLALFNLLPCFPMDGGRILRSVLALVLGKVRPRRAFQARLTATRIAVRYVARPIALAAILVTIFYTQFWLHIPLFLFLALVGEAEYLLLKESMRVTASPLRLRLLPISARPTLKPRFATLPPRPAWRLTVLDPAS